MQQLVRGGFVLSDDLLIEPDGAGGFIINGKIHCEGGIYIDVSKQVVRIAGEDANPLVQTAAYKYNVVLSDRGNIFRYDSPHPDHNEEHHVHWYDVLNGDKTGTITFIYTEDEIPTLQEVILEAADWYYEHRDQLRP